MKPDKVHAEEIRSCSSRLEAAMASAIESGLVVEIDIEWLEYVGGKKRPHHYDADPARRGGILPNSLLQQTKLTK